LSAFSEVTHYWQFGNSQFEVRNSKFIMQPEILHPCSSCGAAIREPAMFCPECGKPLSNASEVSAQPATAGASNLSAIVAEEAAPSEQAPEAQPVAPSAESKESSVNTNASPKKADTKADKPASSASHPGARERTRERLHRASDAARGAFEDNVKRVEKIHHVSTAMFEEASYDPSLRFVLVALGLFIVSVILLVLSKVMG
jgi:hypothetical protein